MDDINKFVSISKKDIPIFKVRFLNAYTLLGLFVFVFSTCGYVVTLASFNEASFYSFDSNIRMVNAVVTDVQETNFGYGDEMSSTPIYAYEFSYAVDQRVFIGRGYSTGLKFEKGDELIAKYKIEQPAIVKANQLRCSPYHLYLILAFVLPLSGIWIMYKGITWADHFISMLSEGIISKASFIRYTQEEDDAYRHFYRFVDIYGQERIASYTKPEKEIIDLIDVIYHRLNPLQSEILHFRALPLIFGRKKIKKLLYHQS